MASCSMSNVLLSLLRSSRTRHYRHCPSLTLSRVPIETAVLEHPRLVASLNPAISSPPPGAAKKRAKKTKASAMSPEEKRLHVLAFEAEVVAGRKARAAQAALDALLPPLPPPSVVFVDTPAGVANAFAALAACNVFGFDTEAPVLFVPGAAPQPPAILQIAGVAVEGGATAYVPSGSAAFVAAPVFLFDLLALLPRYGAEFSRGMAGLLEDADKVLLGVGLRDDFVDLARFYGEAVPCFAGVVRGVVDIGYVTGEVKNHGLSRIAARFGGVRIVKGKMQKSNWARRPLSTQQIVYAANDARAALVAFGGAGIGMFKKMGEFCVGTVVVWECGECGLLALKKCFSNCKKGCQSQEKMQRAQTDVWNKRSERKKQNKRNVAQASLGGEAEDILQVENVDNGEMIVDSNDANKEKDDGKVVLLLEPGEIAENTIVQASAEEGKDGEGKSEADSFLRPLTVPIYGEVVRKLDEAVRADRFEKRKAIAKRKAEGVAAKAKAKKKAVTAKGNSRL